MEKRNFPNPRLNLPKEIRDSTDHSTKVSFKAVDDYIDLVGGYIFTNIDLDYETSNPSHIHAWIQRIVSANVLRSLYVRNAFVDAFNARNTVGIYLPLKAWFEIVGALAAILDLLEKALPADQLSKELEPYILGNKGKSDMRVGTIEAKSVAHMIEKADEYLQKMEEETRGTTERANFFKGFYDVASNPSHPSFEAHELVGELRLRKYLPTSCKVVLAIH